MDVALASGGDQIQLSVLHQILQKDANCLLMKACIWGGVPLPACSSTSGRSSALLTPQFPGISPFFDQSNPFSRSEQGFKSILSPVVHRQSSGLQGVWILGYDATIEISSCIPIKKRRVAGARVTWEECHFKGGASLVHGPSSRCPIPLTNRQNNEELGIYIFIIGKGLILELIIIFFILECASNCLLF